MSKFDTSHVRLSWPGKRDCPSEALDASLRLVSAGHPAHMLIEGDNLSGMRALRRRTGPTVTLAYLDPPFFTGKSHVRVTRRKNGQGKILRSESLAFDDRWEDLSTYLQCLRDRVAAARDLLAPHGSLVLHVDSKTSHYAKVLCDEIFGPRCFASEIVWRYRRWPSRTKNFQRVHDVLLRFVRDPDCEPRFYQAYEPLAPSTQATWGTAKQRAVVNSDGVRTHSSRSEVQSPGTPLGDVWDIGIVAPVSKERTGYPTQKPEALMRRLLETCSAPGDLVLDPYAGSGTTLRVAAELNRRVVGIDASPEALDVIRKRMSASGLSLLEERVEVQQSQAKAS